MRSLLLTLVAALLLAGTAQATSLHIRSGHARHIDGHRIAYLHIIHWHRAPRDTTYRVAVPVIRNDEDALLAQLYDLNPTREPIVPGKLP